MIHDMVLNRGYQTIRLQQAKHRKQHGDAELRLQFVSSMAPEKCHM
jgi:hypothetical protein